MRILKSVRIAAVLGALLMWATLPSQGSQSDSADIMLYKAAFQSYQNAEYDAATLKFRLLLQRFPDTPLRDVTTFWLARSSFHAGDQEQAARYMSIFRRDYPDNPLWETAEKELLLLTLTRREDSSNSLPVPVSAPEEDKPDRHIVAEKSASEVLHQAELQRSEQQAKAKIMSNSEERRLAAERKIQQVRDALRKSEAKRHFRERPEGAGLL